MAELQRDTSCDAVEKPPNLELNVHTPTRRRPCSYYTLTKFQYQYNIWKQPKTYTQGVVSLGNSGTVSILTFTELGKISGLPDLYAWEAMIVDVVFLQDSAPVVIEIDAHLFSTVDPIVPQYGLTTYR